MSTLEKPDVEVVSCCNLCRSNRIEAIDSEFNLCRCDSCGYVFDSPRPTFAAVGAFYSQAGKYDTWLHEEESRDALWKRRLKKVLRHGAHGRLLDIGAGIGQFLHHAQPHFTELAGTEVSEVAIAIAKQKYGLELFPGQIQDINLSPGYFHTITLFHVLEHVPDPAMLIERCHTMLKPQGILIIAVPNDILAWSSKVKKLGKQLGLRAFQKFSPQLGISRAGTSREIHLSHFTPSALRQLLISCGLRNVEESLDPYFVSRGVRLILDHAYYTLHRVLQAALSINSYNTIWMVARKP
jgi:2-polyprenyl-3-methyl-5-hydroxy-6-metoxy-1,4-benzoquinol methylase